MWFNPDAGLLDDQHALAFMYPGVEAIFQPEVSEIADALGMTVPDALHKDDLEQKGFAVVWLARLLTAALEKAGVRGEHLLGHSIGEWSAMIATDCSNCRARAIFGSLKQGSLEVPGVMLSLLVHHKSAYLISSGQIASWLSATKTARIR